MAPCTGFTQQEDAYPWARHSRAAQPDSCAMQPAGRMSSAAHPAPSAAAAAAARAGRGGRAAARAAPEVADAAVVDVERAEGGGRQAQRDAQQRAQDGLVRDHEVHAAGRLQHLCAARARGVTGAKTREAVIEQQGVRCGTGASCTLRDQHINTDGCRHTRSGRAASRT